MGKRKKKKSKLIYRIDSFEDLRGVEKAPADFRLTFWYTNFKSYQLLFVFEENRSGLILMSCEWDGYGPIPVHFEIPATVAGYPVTRIKGLAFKGALKQDRLFIPNTVITIERNAFAQCDIHDLFIPASVSKIVGSPFENSSIYSIKVDKDNEYYDSRNDCNAIINTTTNELIAGSINTIIPETVTGIGEGAFYAYYNLKEIKIPQSVLKIGESAFCSCCGLEKVEIASSIIGKRAFAQCENLKEVLLDDSVSIISEGAFRGCYNLEKVKMHDSLTEICDSAFLYCVNLKELVLSNSLKIIGESAFGGCEKLEIVQIPDAVAFIGLNAFEDCVKTHINAKHSFLLEQARESFSDMVQRQSENDSIHDTELLRLLLSRKLLVIYSELYDSIDILKSYDINEAFKKSLLTVLTHKEYDNNHKNLSEIVPFVRYIYFYCPIHNSMLNGSWDIDLYLEKSYDDISGRPYYKIFDRKERSCTDSFYDIFDKNPLLYLDDYAFFNIDLLEYSTSSQARILDNNYQAVLTSYKDEDGSIKHVASPVLMEENSLKSLFVWNKGIFQLLDSYSGVVTNSFYFSSFFLGKREKGSSLLMANVGIDGSDTTKECVKVFLSEFKSFMDKVTATISNAIQTYQHRQQALEGAIAQVMARNMSHNIGSHVFSNLISNDAYSKLTDRNILKTKAYVSPWEAEMDYPKEQAPIVESNFGNFQLSYFNQYLKSRMDYLSEVTFGIPNMLTTKYVYNDVFKELDRVRILLNYISGIQSFKYTVCLKHNGNIITETNDIAVAFPGDVLGNQALYNIIENIIRNTAKHANKKDQDIVAFNINFIDNSGFINYYCVEIDNGIKEYSIVKLVDEQNKIINESILDKDFKLRTSGLGIIEMKASAAFLRQLDIAKVDSYEFSFDKDDEYTNKQGNLILLKAINKNGALGYRFFIPKPQEMLFVGSWDIQEAQRRKWSNVGIGFIDEDEFINAMQSDNPFPHSFLVCRDGLSEKALSLLSDDNDCKSLLPLRKIMLTEEEADEVKQIFSASDKDLQALKECVWKLYMGNKGIGVDDVHIGEVVSRRYRDRRQIIFENHGTKEAHDDNWGQRTNSPEFWVDNLSSYTQGKLPHFSQLSKAGDGLSKTFLTQYLDGIRPQIRLEIFEAYHNKVVAIDERIQRFANENREGSSDGKGEKIPVSALFESTNVVIPKIKLDPERFDESSVQELESFIDTEIDGGLVLVHYGILERIYKTEKSITERLNEWAKKAQRVVVTSGRGSHSLNLPKSVCFANLSSVLNAFTECRSKYLINNVINQSRRKNE